MRFLNPKTDFAFKKIFGSEASGDILISFLNAVLDLTGADAIVEVAILDPYQAPRIKGWKDSYVDVKARDQKGRSFIVEMQVLVAPGFEKRVLYNACKAYVGQIASAEDYRTLVEVVAITITDFVMFPELAGIVGSFRLRACENPDVTHQDMALVFVELPKFLKPEAELSTTLDRWLYFLRTAGSLQAVPRSLAVVPAIDHALRIANKAALTPEELEDQERREMWIGMQKGMQLDAEEARRQGVAKGLAEGVAQGLAEGVAKGLAEGVAKGLAEGVAQGLAEGVAQGLAEGVAKGLAEGVAKGRAEGESRGRADLLLRLLRRRFGELPTLVTDRVYGADAAALEAWSERLLDAGTLDEVFSRPVD